MAVETAPLPTGSPWNPWNPPIQLVGYCHLTADAANPTYLAQGNPKQRLYKCKTMKIAIGAPLRIVASTSHFSLKSPDLLRKSAVILLKQVRAIPALTIKINIWCIVNVYQYYSKVIMIRPYFHS